MSEMIQRQTAGVGLTPPDRALNKAGSEQVHVRAPQWPQRAAAVTEQAQPRHQPRDQLSRDMEGYGPFAPAAVKPFSIIRRTLDGSALLKIYRGVEPRARRDREVDALMLASRWRLSVPPLLAVGEREDTSWALLRIVPGAHSSATTTADIEAYIERALALAAVLHRRVDGLNPGAGWRQAVGSDTSHLRFLLGQLSPRSSQQPWWEELRALLAPLDREPTVYLHGDIKPEHFLVDGDTVHVIDWEASARGPAVCDHADIVFHLVRDLVYADVDPQELPVSTISQVPAFGPVVAWRVVRWLDRRRPGDIAALQPDDLRRLAHAPNPTDAVRALGGLIAGLRDRGVPR